MSRAVIQVTVNIGKNSQATIEAQIARRGELKIFFRIILDNQTINQNRNVA